MNAISGFLLALAITVQPTVRQEVPPPAPTPSPFPSPSPTPTPPAPSVEDLYRAILPRPIGDPERVSTEVVPAQEGTARAWTGDPLREDPGTRGGLHIGRARITPALHAVYVNAEGALLEAAPVEDRYYELQPNIAAEAPVSSGILRLGYRALLRRGSSFDVVNSTTTHFGDLALEVPLGGVAEIAASGHFSRGLLETAEVDPGREYFFGLGRFRRHQHRLGLRLLPGGRADATVAASLDVVSVDDRSTFFDHEEQAVSARLGYEVRPDLRAALGYSYSRIPPPAERPEAEMRRHGAFAELRGEVLPLTTGTLTIGYARHTSPNAGPGGNRFRGMTASGQLEKSFTPSTNLIVTGMRATHASGFEQNGFYITNAVQVLLRAALPWSLAGEAGAGYHRNDYRTIASSIGVPRRDAIRGWTLGLARQATRHAFIRADYRRDRRDSNVDVFDSRSSALTVRLGIGMFTAPVPR